MGKIRPSPPPIIKPYNMRYYFGIFCFFLFGIQNAHANLDSISFYKTGFFAAKAQNDLASAFTYSLKIMKSYHPISPDSTLAWSKKAYEIAMEAKGLEFISDVQTSEKEHQIQSLNENKKRLESKSFFLTASSLGFGLVSLLAIWFFYRTTVQHETITQQKDQLEQLKPDERPDFLHP